MSHANARLTVHARLELVRRVVQHGRPVAHVAINRIERVMTDNALAYRRGRVWREALCARPSVASTTRLGITASYWARSDTGPFSGTGETRRRLMSLR